MSKIMFASSLDHMAGGDAWQCLLHQNRYHNLSVKRPDATPLDHATRSVLVTSSIRVG